MEGPGEGREDMMGRDESRASWQCWVYREYYIFLVGVESAKQTLRLFDRFPYSVQLLLRNIPQLILEIS